MTKESVIKIHRRVFCERVYLFCADYSACPTLWYFAILILVVRKSHVRVSSWELYILLTLLLRCRQTASHSVKVQVEILSNPQLSISYVFAIFNLRYLYTPDYSCRPGAEYRKATPEHRLSNHSCTIEIDGQIFKVYGQRSLLYNEIETWICLVTVHGSELPGMLLIQLFQLILISRQIMTNNSALRNQFA